MKPAKLIIPPRPSILLELQRIMQQEDVEIGQITGLIKKDASLYATLLACVNSPWMGLPQEVKSADSAIALLGLAKVVNILRAVMVRASFENMSVLENFWDNACEVASITQMLADRYAAVKPEDAYTVGMLHNVGVPIMLNNFDEYEGFLQKHLHKPANELCVHERLKFKTDHYMQGALLAGNWKLGVNLALAIRYQPIAKEVLTGSKALPDETCAMIALLTLAKNISTEYHQFWEEAACEFNASCVLASLQFLEISDAEFKELKEDLISDLVNLQVA